MASLKCSLCSFGIHYHDCPNGIEYEAYSQEMWKAFSDANKQIISFTDDSDDFLIVWRCPGCGCVHTFNGYSSCLKQAYAPCVDNVILVNARKYLVFIDYLRDEIYERHWSAAQFMQSGKYPNDQFFYAMVGDNGVVVYEDAACSKPLRRYKAIETSMEK